MGSKQEEGIKIVCQNRKAFHDFDIVETIEAGIALTGTEVKALREGRANLKDSYAKVKKGEMFLYGMHISPYSHGGFNNHDPERPRKLLLHKREILKFGGKTQEKGFSIVPTKVYFRKGKAKVELALVRGRKLHDKREAIKRREEAREMDRLRKKYKIT